MFIEHRRGIEARTCKPYLSEKKTFLIQRRLFLAAADDQTDMDQIDNLPIAAAATLDGLPPR
jgi:hypothetical protein